MTAITDLAPLGELTHGSPELRRQLLVDVRHIDATDAALLREAVHARDHAQAELYAHRIKGAAMTLGARELAEACSLVAQACREPGALAIGDALKFFDRRLADLEAQLTELHTATPPFTDVALQGEAVASDAICHGLRFLVVEDHEFQLRVITGLLERLGAAQVHGFQDSGEGLRAMADPACPIDIALLDLSMPGMDGMDLMRSLSAMPHSFSLILNSALSPSLMASLLQMAKGFRIKLLGAVSKPLTAAKLAPLVAAYRRSCEGLEHKAP